MPLHAMHGRGYYVSNISHCSMPTHGLICREGESITHICSSRHQMTTIFRSLNNFCLAILHTAEERTDNAGRALGRVHVPPTKVSRLLTA